MTDQAWDLQINALVYRIQQQDKQALNTLYQMTSRKLLATIVCIISDKSESEDLLHDVFIKIWNNANKYSEQGSAWGWLCVVTRHAALDKLRQLKKYTNRFVMDHDNNDIDQGNEKMLVDSLMQALDSQTNLSLDRCLLALKEGARKSILYSYVYGYSHHELSAKMSQPLGTIKAWIRRGVKELKLCLQH